MEFRELLERDGVLIYKNQGDSMQPLIREGKDLVVIRQISGGLKRYDVPLYQRDTGEYVLHRVLRVRPDGYVLCGDNRWRKEYGITDRHITGILTAVIRNGREIPVSSLPCRIYAHLWCDFFYIRAAILMGRSLLKKAARRVRRR